MSFGQSNMEGKARVRPEGTVNIDRYDLNLVANNIPLLAGKW